MRRLIQKFQHHAYSLTAPGIVLALLLAVDFMGGFDRVENVTVDWRFLARTHNDPKADPRLVLIKIDEGSINHFGAWPWNRALVHGEFIKILAAEPPAVLAWDIIFSDPTIDLDKDGNRSKKPSQVDVEFANAMTNLPCVITGAFSDKRAGKNKKEDKEWIKKREITKILSKTQPLSNIAGDIDELPGEDRALFPIREIDTRSYFGFVNAESKTSDGIRRVLPLLVKLRGEVYPSLSLQALCQFWNIKPNDVRIVLGEAIYLPTNSGLRKIPINAAGEIWINYRDGRNFKEYSYVSTMVRLVEHYYKELPREPKMPLLEGNIVYVGQTEPGLIDLGPSPLEATMPLVYVHLNVINNILQQDYLRKIPSSWIAPFWLFLVWVCLSYVQRKGVFYSIAVPALAIGGYLFLCFKIFEFKSILLPLVWPTLGMTLLHSGAALMRWRDEQESRQELKSIFGSYIAPAVMDRLLDSPDEIKLGGHRKPVAILFSDIRGFTTMSEASDEEELVRHLNEYFEKMVGCVNLYHGTLHKFIGDAVMAVWGDVVVDTESHHAKNAVRAALAMRAELVELNAGWKSQNRQAINIGIGINYGTVVVGNIGATQRKEFSVIGDAVNLASRLEGVTKQFHTDLVIGESVFKLLDDEFVVRNVGLIIVQGRIRPVRTYEVLADRNDPKFADTFAWVGVYERGFEAFLARDFVKAAQCFQETLQAKPEDYCGSRYLEASLNYLKSPPAAGWDGALKMDSK